VLFMVLYFSFVEQMEKWIIRTLISSTDIFIL